MQSAQTAWRNLLENKSNVIGKGGFGTVYGPYSKTEIEAKIAPIEPNIESMLHSDKQYVIKISQVQSHMISGKRQYTIPKPFTKNVWREKCGKQLEDDTLLLEHFILPLGVWPYSKKFNDSYYYFEIQEYGGMDLLKFYQQQTTITIKELMVFLTSIITILKDGFFLIDQCGYYISDTKIENTVVDPNTYQLKLIDLTFNKLEKDPSVFSIEPDATPTQLFGNGIPYNYSSKRSKSYIAKNSVYNIAFNKTFPDASIRSKVQRSNRTPPYNRSDLNIISLAKFTLLYSMIMILMFMMPPLRQGESQELSQFRSRFATFVHHVLKTRLRLNWEQIIQDMRNILSQQQSGISKQGLLQPLLTPPLKTRKQRCKENKPRYLKWICDWYYLFDRS